MRFSWNLMVPGLEARPSHKHFAKLHFPCNHGRRFLQPIIQPLTTEHADIQGRRRRRNRLFAARGQGGGIL